jgi:hypothetical protein
MKPFLDKSQNEQGEEEYSLNALSIEDLSTLIDICVQKATEKHTIIQRCVNGNGSIEDAKLLHQTQADETQLIRLLKALTGKTYCKLP